MEIVPKITGIESELGLICYKEPGLTGPKLENGKVLQEMVHCLPEETKSVRAGNTVNYWLSTGARLYADTGDHIEITTPESTSIDQTVEYDAAADDIILHALNELVKNEKIGSFRLLKNVSDEQGNYYGAHVSYLAPREINPRYRHVMEALATHNATNAVYAGAGRVSKKGFNVAQKLFRLNILHSTSAHGIDRPLVDTRDQSLGDETKYRRIHDSHGDATILPLSSTLRIAGTSLVLQLLEHGVDLSDLALANPLGAAKTTAHDTSLQSTVGLANGRRMRPAEIQLELALRARDLGRKEKLTEEDMKHAETLIEVCELLLTHPEQLIGKLDWITKNYAIDRKFPDPNPRNLARRRRLALLFETLNGGTGYKLRQRIFESEGRSDRVADAMSKHPEDTRAAQRGRIVIAGAMNPQIKSKFVITEWDRIKVKPRLKDEERVCLMLNPYQTSYPAIEKAIGM